MAKSNSIWRIINVLFPLRDFLYLLQLEEYEVPGYWHRLGRFFWRRNLERRDTLRWTGRVLVVGALVKTGIAAVLVVVGVTSQSWYAVIAAFAACALAVPLFVLAANGITMPLFALAHVRVRAKARGVVASMQGLHVVAIAGSHGKTTTKNLLYEMMRYTHRVQLIGGNINTPTGVAQWVLNNLQPHTELLIVEMDAYRIGEIAATCKVTPPDVAIITAIGDQHLMRFGSQENIVRGIAEVFLAAKGQCFCTPETAAMLRNEGIDVRVLEVSADHVDAPHLSASIHEDAALAAAAAKAHNVPQRFIDEAIRAFTPPDRRQKPATVFGYEGIDDSYNISRATARAGVEAARAMADAAEKKLVVLTAGIPELPVGMSEKENAAYGKYLAEHADAVVLLRSEFADALRKGIGRKTVRKEAGDLPEATKVLHANFPITEYVLLFQPELTDASY